MDLSHSPEQQLLSETVTRFVDDRYSFEQRKGYCAEEAGYSRENWALLAELGLLGLLLPPEDGGFGGGPVETGIVMEPLGRGLVVEPYLPAVVWAGALLDGHELAGEMAAGKCLVVPAVTERAGRHDLAHVQTVVAGGRISGAKSLVPVADSADWLLVSARDGGGVADRAGIGLYLVDARGGGVSQRCYATQDDRRAAEVTFDGAAVAARLAEDGFARIDAAADRVRAALCAETAGAAAALLALTGEYLRTRRQFGRPLAAFQVLQHRLVDMRDAVEECRSMALVAARDADSPDPVTRRRGVSAAKAKCARLGRFVAQAAVQMHGGIGMTMEYAAGHYMKRLAMIEMSLGDADWHTARFAALMEMPATPG